MIHRGILVRLERDDIELYGIVVTQAIITQVAIATHAVDKKTGVAIRGLDLKVLLGASGLNISYPMVPRTARYLEQDLRKLISTYDLSRHIEKFAADGRMFVFDSRTVKEKYGYKSKERGKAVAFLLPNKVATKMAIL